ncbi:MAG TPA: ABC transporter permease [Vicinamibacterales bacterium]|nr:ABC transporter permease [Vicinamibacterales bacterium]
MALLHELWRDVRVALRGIRRAPVPALAVVLSLGAGIGVNTVVFSWLDAAVLRPLPGVRGAADLVLVELRRVDGSYASMSWAQYQDYRRRVTTIRDLLAFRMAPLYVGETGATERAYGLLVSDNYFAALGLRPALGRFLLPEETSVAGAAPVLVISHEYWQTRYGGSATVIGTHVRINGSPLTVVGVAPRGFEGTIPRLKFDLFLPATLAPVLQPGSRELEDRTSVGYSAVGVLRDRQTRRAAQADVTAAARALAKEFPQTDGDVTAEVLSFWDAPRGPQKFMAMAVVAVQGILLLMLLSVCASAANLVLTRALSRQREIGVRAALGAGPWRIGVLALVDAVVLALIAVALGTVFAWWGTDALRAMPPLHVRGLPITFDAQFSWAAVTFAGALGLGSALLFATPVVAQFARADPSIVLRSASLRVSPNRIRGVIMGVQIALAVFVLIAGGLAFESFVETRTAPTGFRIQGVLLASYDLTGPGGPDDGRAFAGRAIRAIRAAAGVEDAAIASSVPLDIHGLPSRPFSVEGHARSGTGVDRALTNTVTPGYFTVLDIPFVEGRDFVSLEDGSSPPQAVVNDAFVRTYLPRLDPIGRVLTSRGREYRICGVVRTSLSDSFGEPPLPVIYLSYRDAPSLYGEIHVRTREGAETAVTAAVRRAIQQTDPELPLFDVRTMSDHIESNLIFRRIPARLFSVIAPVLAGLVAIGVYALVAYAASRRRQEIAVRLAIGAAPRRVARELVGDTVRVAAAGSLAGLVAAVIVLANGAELSLQQAAVFALVPIAVASIAAAAAYVPAQQAIVRPSWGALRDE